ncbi:hypothetical protein BWQ96_06174 [Gracilariopsis chorda]|uniref:Hyaluronan/mRNA-binding protein domain-containing protein n=1 Tax=Gracilariopsis chorda TaxID=448386 RepID=A0A2V3IPV8_9FLOR|nr:hypothetical protein BWQ96_06174 [Gracilariopsis chorda]|eukprot:PXF44093.1 hypothetical protein BWQ96_06174 [Gracilariopsis chorda]
MNSFALLQDDVEDASELTPDNVASSKPHVDEVAVPAVDVQDAAVNQNDDSSAPHHDDALAADPQAPADKDQPDQKPLKQRDLTLEEYLEKKAAMSSGLASLNSRGLRQPNDGVDGFEKMSVLKKNDAPDDNSIMRDVAVKAQQQAKTIKDSTQAAVARNAEIQKFFKPDPSDRRRGDYRRGYRDRRGAGRGTRGMRGARGAPGRGGAPHRGGRGAYRGGYTTHNDDDFDHRRANGRDDQDIVPDVDDTSAFPSL